MTTAIFDPVAYQRFCSSKTIEELLEIVAFEAHTYEHEAKEIARTELLSRGIDEVRLPEVVRDLKVRRYDLLTAPPETTAVKLPRWMFWVCLIESGPLSWGILLYLAHTDRPRELVDAFWTIVLGLVIKVVVPMAVLAGLMG